MLPGLHRAYTSRYEARKSETDLCAVFESLSLSVITLGFISARSACLFGDSLQPGML